MFKIILTNLSQIPLYAPALFQHDYDGEGMSFVFYFKLSENYEELPLHFQENIRVWWSYFITHASYISPDILEDQISFK